MIFSVSIATTFAENWTEKAVGFYCDNSICRCTIYYENGECYAIPDGTSTKCKIFKMSGSNTYNAYFSYDDCKYFVYIPYWPM